jgi:hypothetical protein
VVAAETEEGYRAAVEARISTDDGTRPDRGWPWPWESSNTTDFAYTWSDGGGLMSCFGTNWIPTSEDEPEEWPETEDPQHPDMTDRQNVTFGKGSGLIVFGGA